MTSMTASYATGFLWNWFFLRSVQLFDTPCGVQAFKLQKIANMSTAWFLTAISFEHHWRVKKSQWNLISYPNYQIKRIELHNCEKSKPQKMAYKERRIQPNWLCLPMQILSYYHYSFLLKFLAFTVNEHQNISIASLRACLYDPPRRDGCLYAENFKNRLVLPVRTHMFYCRKQIYAYSEGMFIPAKRNGVFIWQISRPV